MALHLSLSRADLANYVAAQISHVLPERRVAGPEIQAIIDGALERLEFCLDRLRQRYHHDERGATFDHRHTDQYAMLLYLVANTAYRKQQRTLAAQAYALNKALHGLDAFYEVELPPVFAFQHPVGTVLGRARYGDYFFVYQRCSVGSSIDGHYPQFGEGVVMFGGSAVIGDVTVGSNVWLSINTTLLDGRVPDNSVVFGATPNITIKPTRRDVRRDMFRIS
jgi:serine O-acetyltransferase